MCSGLPETVALWLDCRLQSLAMSVYGIDIGIVVKKWKLTQEASSLALYDILKHDH